MTVKECYDQMGGSYADAVGRFRNDVFLEKYLGKLPADPSYRDLCAALEQGDIQGAFVSVHNLKGLCANLGLDTLGHSAETLCDALRGGTPQGDVDALLADVRRDYEAVLQAVAALTGSR